MTVYLSGIEISEFNNIITLDSANGYIQLPKLTNVQRNALVAVNGMEIYNSDTDQIERYANGYWIPVQNRNQLEQSALLNFGLNPVISDDNAKTFMHSLTNIARSDNWNRMNMSTAQGAAEVVAGYKGAIFDGKYIYFAPENSDTFLRFDTKGTSFITAADWQRMSMSTAQGAAALNTAYIGEAFDGRYIYYVPENSVTFIRFDTQGTSFTTAADWQRMSMSTAQGAAAGTQNYRGAIFDGRYIYYAAYSSATFLRFDTQGTSFTTAADWQRMSMSTAQGAAEVTAAYNSASFDGRYIYYGSQNTATFLRFDTQGTSFTTAADWQKMSMSTAQGAVVVASAYSNPEFDGRYIYYTPYSSATALRFDTQGTSFTTVADWQRMSISTAQGGAAVATAYVDSAYDGKYIYFPARNSNTFLRVMATPSRRRYK